MKVKLLLVNRTENSWIKEGMDDYLKRLKNYLNFEVIELDISLKKAKTADNQLLAEANKLQSHIKSTDHVVLLDENGKDFNSIEFAEWLNKKLSNINGDLIFIVGGAFGFDNSIKQRSNDVLSLSKMTFTHQMVRVFFVEQLYRGMTILKNQPYHHQ